MDLIGECCVCSDCSTDRLVPVSEAGRGWVAGAEVERSRRRNGSAGGAAGFPEGLAEAVREGGSSRRQVSDETTQPRAGRRCRLGRS